MRRVDQVMALRETGMRHGEIARELGVSACYVSNLISKHVEGGGDEWQGRVRDGSAKLARAIRRHHPDRYIASRERAA